MRFTIGDTIKHLNIKRCGFVVKEDVVNLHINAFINHALCKAILLEKDMNFNQTTVAVIFNSEKPKLHS